MRQSFTDSLNICCITFNMHGQTPTADDIDLLFKKHKEKEYDIYIIGTEECLRSILLSLFYWDKTTWEDQIQEYFGRDKYTVIGSQTLSAIHIIALIKKDLLIHVKKVGNNYIKAGGMYNTLGNKGACYVYFKYKQSNFLFINTHLAAFKNNNAKRIDNFYYILSNISITGEDEYKKLFNESGNYMPLVGNELINKFDMTVFMGDLNSRTDCNLEIMEGFLETKDINKILSVDQLLYSKENNLFDIHGFEETQIKFMPTFKFVPGTVDTYAKTEENTPSYTDRILYKINKDKNIKLEVLSYDSDNSLTFSDHKPVILAYSIFF